jgi:hypothetical protein
VRRAYLRRRQRGFGACHFGRIRTRIDREQRIALLHDRAFAEMHGFDRAGHARTDFHAVHRFDAAGEFIPFGDGLADRRDTSTAGAGGGVLACASPPCQGRRTEVATPAPRIATMAIAISVRRDC